MKTFTEQLNTLRKERHLTQEQLAQELNVSRTTISRWENGTVLPDIETIKHLFSYLGFNFFQNEALRADRGSAAGCGMRCRMAAAPPR